MLDRLTADSRIIDINRDCIVTSNAEGWGIRRFNYPRSLALVRGGGEGQGRGQSRRGRNYLGLANFSGGSYKPRYIFERRENVGPH